MAQKQFKIGLSNNDKLNMAQDVYERVLALTFNEYDTTTEYEVGDFVVYNDQLYKCISATSGAWDSSKWQLATLNDLVADIEGAVAFVNDKANVDGNYPTMTVGVADNLSPYDEEAGTKQSAPFNFQASGTNNGANPLATVGELALLKEKQGNTVVVNQLVQSPSFDASTGWQTYLLDNNYSISNGKFSILDFNQTSVSSQLYQSPFAHGKTGDKMLIIGDFDYDNDYYLSISLGGGNVIYEKLESKHFQKIIKLVADTSEFSIYVNGGANNTTTKLEISNIYCINLTQWFNGDIPQDLLDHPEHFFRYYQGSLAYNEGTLVNANGRYIKAIGRNQWDETTFNGYWDENNNGVKVNFTSFIASNDHIKVIPNATYHLESGTTAQFYVLFYDKDDNLISFVTKNNHSEFTTPANCVSITWYSGNYGTTYNHDITISLYYEDESGYDQYYPYKELANVDTSSEVLRSAGNAKDYKTPNGTIHRLVGNRAYQSGDENDSSLTTDGTTTNYPLAEPTTEQGTPFSENVEIDDFGSMDFGGTNGVPQGALIFYPVDYKAYLDTLHKYTDGDPDNLALKSDLAVVNEKIGAKIPECPTTTDGTYVLKATVSNGSVVYAWVLEE